MTTRRPYRGYGLSAIDGKGRVAIPAKLRSRVDENAGSERTIILSRSRTAPCLTAYDMVYADTLLADALALEMAESDPAAADMDRENRNRAAFGVSEDVPFDQSGRLIVPPLLRKIGKLEDLAFFHGSGPIIEIWNPHVLLRTPGIPAMMTELVELLLAEHAA